MSCSIANAFNLSFSNVCYVNMCGDMLWQPQKSVERKQQIDSMFNILFSLSLVAFVAASLIHCRRHFSGFVHRTLLGLITWVHSISVFFLLSSFVRNGNQINSMKTNEKYGVIEIAFAPRMFSNCANKKQEMFWHLMVHMCSVNMCAYIPCHLVSPNFTFGSVYFFYGGMPLSCRWWVLAMSRRTYWFKY